MAVRWESGILALHGELDMGNAHLLDDAIGQAILRGDEIVIDMAELTFVDSTAINALVNGLRQGLRITVLTPSPHVRRVFAIAGLDDLDGFDIVE